MVIKSPNSPVPCCCVRATPGVLGQHHSHEAFSLGSYFLVKAVHVLGQHQSREAFSLGRSKSCVYCVGGMHN